LRWLGPEPGEVADVVADRLAESLVQHRDKPFATVQVFEITELSGWAATDPERAEHERDDR